MTIRDIIMPLHPDATAGARAAEDFALALAARMEAHLTALAPSFSYVLSGPNGARLPAEIREELQQRSDEAARAVLESFDARARALGVLSDADTVRAGPVEFAERFAARARTRDLSVVPQPTEDDAGWGGSLVEAVLFGTGRPVLIVPYVQQGAPRFERVLVAWDGSKEAARAVHDALPILRHAKDVEVLTLHTERHRPENLIPGADLAAHLARHRLTVTARTTDATEIGLAEAMLSHAADNGSDVIVMGGYAHSRLRHLVFGGATSGILRSMTVPILMAH